ncbi:MAG TPA: hypothetical protein VGY54_02865 [Polyangiaceae bacterium]|nr:hypothetical protein [Polyangiaceae bacterium]
MLRYVLLVSMLSLVLAFGCGGRASGTSAGTSGSAQTGAGANAGASVGGSTGSNAGASTGYGTPQDCAAAGGQCVIGGGGGLCAREGPANTCNCNPGCNPGGAICCLAFVDAADASTVGDARIPLNHRAVHPTCPSQRGPGVPAVISTGTSGLPVCTPTQMPYCCSDADCNGGTNGRCINLGHAGQQCTWDACFADSNCRQGAPCICRSSPADNSANVCALGSGCVVDSDCGPGGYCSQSVLLNSCDAPGPFYCHTAMDTCIDDSDCFVDGGGAFFCAYDPQVRHWACSPENCPP